MKTAAPDPATSPGRLAAPSPAAPSSVYALDDVDRRIVDHLRADGRASMRAVAAALHISRANVYNRVERLERDGVITGYAALVDPQRYGQTVAAYVYLNVTQQSWKSIQAKVVTLPEVVGGALVSGEHDIVLLVRTRDAAALRNLVLNELQSMPEVLSTHTVLIFEELSPTGAAAARTPAGSATRPPARSASASPGRASARPPAR